MKSISVRIYVYVYGTRIIYIIKAILLNIEMLFFLAQYNITKYQSGRGNWIL